MAQTANNGVDNRTNNKANDSDDRVGLGQLTSFVNNDFGK